jgi:hypothetical protein
MIVFSFWFKVLGSPVKWSSPRLNKLEIQQGKNLTGQARFKVKKQMLSLSQPGTLNFELDSAELVAG